MFVKKSRPTVLNFILIAMFVGLAFRLPLLISGTNLHCSSARQALKPKQLQLARTKPKQVR